jgi:hypothetical protein
LHKLDRLDAILQQDRALSVTTPNQQQTFAASMPGLQQAILNQQRTLLIDTNLSLGRMHARAGVPYEAIDCYNRVLSLDPSHGNVRRYLAEAFIQIGDMRQALNFLAGALGFEISADKSGLPRPAEERETNMQQTQRIHDDRSGVTIGTSLMPRRIGAQKAAVSSWRRLGFDVVSVNNAEEIEQIRPHFPTVRFHEVNRTADDLCGRPLVPITEIVAALTESQHNIVGIMNSDIELNTTNAFVDRIRIHVPGNLIIGNRVDVDCAGSTNGQVYTGGYDLFFFEKGEAEKFSSSEMVMGMPWWDFWMPLAAHLSGLRLTKLTQAGALHYTHPVGYSFELFMKLAERFTASLGSIAKNHISATQSELAELTRNLFLLIDAHARRSEQNLPAHTIGILCAFSNFLIDHLATTIPVARNEVQ